jgi:hypothetical protein
MDADSLAVLLVLVLARAVAFLRLHHDRLSFRPETKKARGFLALDSNSS